ncbi:MAG: ABC transporter permease [Phyllobacteriaceae bacterium]|jgi:ribose transport system permease protein|nr:ABC transporter permease [Phyllobacteriaceae bacterium]
MSGATQTGAPAFGGEFFARYGIYLFLALLIAGGGLISPSFVSAGNINNMLVQLAPLGIVVIGQAFVIISRGLDLSVASVMATAAVMTSLYTSDNSSAPLIVASALAVALATGLVNGLLVTKRNVSPFLATLATAIMLQGIRFWLTSGAPSGNIPPLFKQIGAGSLGGVPISLVIFLVIAVVFWVVLHRSAYGRALYIVGGNPIAGRLVGLSSDRVIIVAYMISSTLAATAGLILAGFAGVVDNFVGRGFELDSIVAAVIGGVALSGGRGGIAGAVVGAAILIAIFNLVLLIGAPVQFQIIIKGAVIVLAAAFYVKKSKS